MLVRSAQLVTIVAVVLAARVAPARAPVIALSTKQLVVVTTSGWSDLHARLERFERDRRGHFRAVGAPIGAVLGRGGLGWGIGVHPRAVEKLGGPVKHEGDGRAPAGAFRLVESTGYAPDPPRGATLRYRQAGPRLRCVDDPKSPQYNAIVEEPESGPPWSSAEKMHRDDAAYTRAIVVEHNREPAEPGRGSCIFVHVWSGPEAGTSGCTALDGAELESLLAWLRAPSRPVLVALPRELYVKVAAEWGLPPIAK